MGAVLRYVVTGKDEWLALLVFCSPALHLKARDQWLQWKATEVGQRRHLIAQNSRFLIRVNAHDHPNLASCILGQVAQRIREDWQQAFGHPVLALETFIDPQRFRGTCYKAAGWQRLGRTRGCKRSYQDYYEDARHPKELWMRALSRKELRLLRQPRLPEELLAPGAKPPPPPCPVPTRDLDSLWHQLRNQVRDYRDPHAPAWVHFDGKVLKGAEPAPAADPKIIEAHVPAEIDPQQQKPKANKALTLVNFMTDDQWIPRRSAWRVRLAFCASRPPVNTCAKGWPGKQHTMSVMPSAAFGNRKRLPKSCSKPCGAIGPLKIASITGATAL